MKIYEWLNQIGSFVCGLWYAYGSTVALYRVCSYSHELVAV
jgi:hypothetical protein